ncbi:CDP-glucose 4,6-dehydratase [Roseibium sediminicola]|uniref:CDP-glucose 4,6-dehydratase n=1 Tax=Roseibium sediminicola TaxID=2933272 RepID=A0ABT0GWZ9_9HYPH|nr:CDP-glucose 4,6-dehydratase [Roseibium sp. CAU 1639]MCK7613973.1 CDP-glucose 4,6-dehydratase [Roseibium sp. CAU 1639]
MTYWNGKRVLITGHTGFKGAWLSELLLGKGAELLGVALAPDDKDSLHDRLSLERRMTGVLLDIREAPALAREVRGFRPEIVLHLAAQSLVRRSYRDPVGTWASNVMGTVNLLEALRGQDQPATVVIVTTDKVYENNEWAFAYREIDPLGGHDPYSASKAATELVAASWRRSFGSDGLRIATARAGNVIGGGDWAEDRLVPDIVRALRAGGTIDIRNPASIRPWQHVLDPLKGYLMLAEKLHEASDGGFQSAYNFGPEPADIHSVQRLVETMLRHWPGHWTDASDPDAVHEAGRLSLSIDKARCELGWSPVWSFEDAVERTVHWYRQVDLGADPAQITRDQIAAFEEAA